MPDRAEVTETGLLIPKEFGFILVRVKDKENPELETAKAFEILNVDNPGEEQHSLFIFGTGDAREVAVGQTLQMMVVRDGQPYTNVNYSVSNNNAEISLTGLVTGLVEGEVIVTATDVEEPSLTATWTLQVKPAEAVQEYLIAFGEGDRSTIETDGGTLQIWVKKMPGDVDYNNVTYTVDRTDLADISETGRLTAKADGVVTVTVTDKDNTELTGNVTITISNQTANESGATESLILFGEADKDYIDVDGGTLQLHTKKLPDDVEYTNVFYTIMDNNIAEVDFNTGIVSARGNGVVTVTVTDRANTELTATKDITVSNQSTFKVDPYYVQLLVGEEVQLTANKNDVAYDNVTWSLNGSAGGAGSNSVELSETGLVKGVALGGTYVRATDNADPTKYHEATVWVVESKD